MTKNHRVWTAVFVYCKNIPIDQTLIDQVKFFVKEGKNVLILIKKEDHKSNPKHIAKDKFDALCKVFDKEMTNSKIIISTVPDINEIIEIED